MRFLAIASLAGLLGASSGALAADPMVARSLAATCANCHGTNGKAVSGTALSPLAGTPAAHTEQKMKDFRDGTRPATIMHQIAKGYTDAQIALIAAYFAEQK